MVPFIFRFAKPIPSINPEILGYDSERQIALVLQGDIWVDRLAAGKQDASTGFTKVRTETTDDE